MAVPVLITSFSFSALQRDGYREHIPSVWHLLQRTPPRKQRVSTQDEVAGLENDQNVPLDFTWTRIGHDCMFYHDHIDVA